MGDLGESVQGSLIDSEFDLVACSLARPDRSPQYLGIDSYWRAHRAASVKGQKALTRYHT